MNKKVENLNNVPTSTYEVSLCFDEESELKIWKLIRQVSEITNNFYRIEKEIPPHITLGMFRATETQRGSLVEKVQRFSFEFQKNFSVEQKTIELNCLDSFKNRILFLTLQNDKSFKNQNQKNDVLFELNKILHCEILQDFVPANNNLYLPNNFFPHCTIATGLSLAQMNNVFENKTVLNIPNQLFLNKISLATHSPFEYIL